MSERQMTHERPGGRGTGPSVWDGQDPSAVMATVSHAPYSEDLPVAGMTVAQIRTRFRDRFDLHPAAIPVIDGHDAEEDTTLLAGQLLTFIRRSGEKGRASCRAN